MLHCYSDTEFLVVSPVLFVRSLQCAVLCVGCFVSIFRHNTRNLSPNSFYSSIPLQRVSCIVCVCVQYFGTRKISMHEKIRLENIRNYFCNVLDPYHLYSVHQVALWRNGDLFSATSFLSDRINANHTEKFSEIFSKNNVWMFMGMFVRVCVRVQWVAFWCVLFQIPRRSTWHLRGLLCTKHIKCPTSNTHIVCRSAFDRDKFSKQSINICSENVKANK